MYDRLSEREQEQVAEVVAKQLQERVKTDKCCRAMLGTYIPALARIDVTTVVDGTSTSIQDKVVTPELPSQ